MAAKKPRKTFTGMTDEHRLKIQNSNILSVLVDHVQGNRPMSATQVTAGIALLRKIMPDLASVEQTGDAKQFVINVPTQLGSDDWSAKYAPRSPTLPVQGDEPDPDTQH